MTPPNLLALALSRPGGNTGRLLDLLTLALLVGAVGVVVAADARQARRWLALQGTALAAGAALLAGSSGQRGLLLAAGIVLAVKAVAAQAAPARWPATAAAWRWPAPIRSGFGLAALALVLEIVAFLLVPGAAVPGTAIAGPVLPAALALVLAGLAGLPGRPVPSLLTMGNGACSLALSAATGPTAALAFCLAFDLLAVGFPAMGLARYDSTMH